MKGLIVFVALLSIFIGFGYHKFDELTRPLPLPKFDTNKYWGPGDAAKYKEDKTIKPFKIDIKPEIINDLQKQLNRTLKLTEPLERVNFEYGYNTDAMTQVVEYWREKYLAKWSERQEYLNSLPQFTTEIQGLSIHFIHAKPSAEALKKKKVLPLLLLHGWPGSVREFYNFIPILTEPADMSDYVFEVVAPSLVGYGWSQPASKVGLNAAEMAIVMRNLMLRLGFNKFLVQGGDWGSIIGSSLTTIFPDNVIGYHSNMCILNTPLSFFREHHFPLIDKLLWGLEESGYFHIQATKPDTIGTVLIANPVGLASYILEKFQASTGPAYNQRFDGMTKVFTIDALLDNVMIYYLTNSATTAGRLYKESMSKEFLSYQMDRVQSPAPMGCARFRFDLPAAMDWQLKDKFPNLIHSKYFNQAGHFAALEVPVMLNKNNIKMGLFVRIFIVAFCLGLAALIQNYRLLSQPLPAPKFDLQEYWGPGKASDYKENTAVTPFDIAVKLELIEDLKTQLQRPLKLHDPLEGVGFEYGFNSNYLQTVIKYWRDDYMAKWPARESFLKKFPHFQTQIQGLNLHFIHVKPKKTEGKKVLPLILLHGWPGSVREFYDIIPLLTTPNEKSDYVFEVVAPSLPGYGWSQGASKKNFGPAQMSIVLRNLMLRLGHKKFIVQGGDWGSIVGSNMAALFPENVLGYHSNMCGTMGPIGMLKMVLANFMPSLFYDKQYSAFFKPLPEFFANTMEEMGYMHLQATKPDTIGTALAHNPVGLAAYILEKFSTWTNGEYKHLPDGGLTKRYTMDALLDNVMIYYITNSITTSQRLYAEQFSKEQMSLQMDRVGVKVPTACARFLHDLWHATDCQLKDKFLNLVQSTYHLEGGHFAAMEVPNVLYNDFIDFEESKIRTLFCLNDKNVTNYKNYNTHTGRSRRPIWPTHLRLLAINYLKIYADQTIDDLKAQLNRSLQLTEPLEGVTFEYGFNTKQLQEIIEYWRDDYLPRWREREVFLWQFNHFTTDIQGLRMHFLHLMVYDEYTVDRHHYPVLLLHGWPGSVREFYSLIHKLHQTKKDKNNKYIFNVIVPSLPGYAWSQGTSKKGLGPAQMAVMMRNLMLRLGYKKFFIQGGDWGSVIGSHIATLFPENVLGYHSNLCTALTPKAMIKGAVASLFPSFFSPKGYENFFFPMSEKLKFIMEETGYMHLQSTKPDTIGTALQDNPVGLAAYILEKFSTWTNPSYRSSSDGGLKKRFKLDALLGLVDNIMIYHLTNSITTSQRIYKEHYAPEQRALQLERVPTNVLTGCARFKNDLMHFLDFQLKDKYPNLIHSTYHNEGGHFAAMELPTTLYEDFINFVKKVEKVKKISSYKRELETICNSVFRKILNFLPFQNYEIYILPLNKLIILALIVSLIYDFLYLFHMKSPSQPRLKSVLFSPKCSDEY
ncbi:Juvenile hormone epoxide hydrolase 1 [Lucilia cuprina]|nr:Juvenile hormone epoxide hydrolase 1 [Lucilia cuprina]